MESRNVHANCVKVQFGPKSKMPTDKEVFAFFRKREWTSDSLYAMFREPRECSVYVKFQSEELMKAALLKCPPSDMFAYDNGESAQVTFATARGDFRYVRIFGLPIEVDEKHVTNVLSKYGKIHQMVRERYGPDTGHPILNGVRGAHMEISVAIPPQLHVQHFQVRVFYEGMQNKCFVCGSPDHVKVNCPKRASVSNRLRLNDSGSTSYAGVLSGLSASPGQSLAEVHDKQVQDEVTPHEEVASAAMTIEEATPPEATATETMHSAKMISHREVNGSTSNPQFPVPAARTCVGKNDTIENEQELTTGDAEWTATKKRGRKSRIDASAAVIGSDSSEPESPKQRLLEKQPLRTRSRSQRKKSK